MNMINLKQSLLTVVVLVLASCTTQPGIIGLWQNTGESGSIDFKASGEVVIVDNMSATVTGTYEIEQGNLLKIKLIASDILRDSIEPVPETVVTAYILTLDHDRLQLRFPKQEAVENYRRIR